MLNHPEVEIEPDSKLKGYRLQTENCQIELKPTRAKAWKLSITEPSGSISEIHFSADTEISASITSD